MPFAAVKSRYESFVRTTLSSLSEIERNDVKAFDRWFYAGRGWISIIGIIAVNLSLAAVASQLPWNMSFLEAAILINVLVFMLLWAVLTVWFGYRKFHGKLLRYIFIAPALALIGAFVGAGAADLIKGGNAFDWLIDNAKIRHIVVASMVLGFLYALFTSVIVHLRNREYAALAVKLELERRESDLSCQLAESRLKMLQLQIEPHFLFNTLGSAQQLARVKAPEAARLIDDLIKFLRAATPSMRDEYSTLADDAAMVNAYLAIMKTRLGARLRFSVSIPQELESFRLAPGMLITLVENAIKHGIEPYAPGGEIRVTAVRQDSQVRISVADTGAGLGTTPGQGIGLANIRERLDLMHCDRARLCLAENTPRGFVACLELPDA
jgi:sensor histidine kinase YesM